jgi:hypothetical protein
MHTEDKPWFFDRTRHGSLYDRGAADSYYNRAPRPHFGGVGGDSGPRWGARTDEEIAEYMAGYEFNEKFGDKKEYE